MSRARQTAWIVAAILGALGIYLMAESILHPDLDGVHPYWRCDYYAYRTNHGGDLDSCKAGEASAAGSRVAAGVGSKSDWLAVDARKAELMKEMTELKASGVN